VEWPVPSRRNGKSEDLLCCHDLAILARGSWMLRSAVLRSKDARELTQLAPKSTNWNRAAALRRFL
jgi:hypothetical protein